MMEQQGWVLRLCGTTMNALQQYNETAKQDIFDVINDWKTLHPDQQVQFSLLF